MDYITWLCHTMQGAKRMRSLRRNAHGWTRQRDNDCASIMRAVLSASNNIYQ